MDWKFMLGPFLARKILGRSIASYVPQEAHVVPTLVYTTEVYRFLKGPMDTDRQENRHTKKKKMTEFKLPISFVIFNNIRLYQVLTEIYIVISGMERFGQKVVL